MPTVDWFHVFQAIVVFIPDMLNNISHVIVGLPVPPIPPC